MNPKIQRIILGNRKYKNLVTNGLPVNTDGWITYGGFSTLSIVNGWLRATYAAFKVYAGRNGEFDIPAGHKVYFVSNLRASAAGNLEFHLVGTAASYASVSRGNTALILTQSASQYSGIITATGIVSGFSFDGVAYTTAGDWVEAQSTTIIDLDALGLENKSLEWCDANIPQNIIW